MYSGTTLTPLSGRIIGAHQKIDRLAWTNLQAIVGKQRPAFPSIRSILHFEGFNGPDAIKRKSPARDEPWHYYDPFDSQDSKLVLLISDHYDRLVKALKTKDHVRSAFESAWLAHALVDGLTPAHHYPYEAKLIELRGGAGLEDRTTFKQKVVLPGDTRREQVMNNWKMWGPKGLFTTHYLFEWGVAALLVSLSGKRMMPSAHDLKELDEHGVLELFRRNARHVAALGMYDRYYRQGWTPRLAREVRRVLAPTIVQTVTLAWYAALLDAGLIKTPKE